MATTMATNVKVPNHFEKSPESPPDVLANGDGNRHRVVSFANSTLDPNLLLSSFRSSDAQSSASSTHSRSVSSSLRSNMMREQKDRDPLYYYEIVQVLGVGSMGSVSKVRKRRDKIGGSARQDIVDSIRRTQRATDCLKIPLLGGLFKYCIDPSAENESIHGSVHGSVHGSGSSHGGNQVANKRDAFQAMNDPSAASSLGSNLRSAHEIIYALKSIHLNRVNDESFVEELRNEIEILKKLDHPHIVRPMETFEHRKQLFIVMELCSGGDLYSRDPYTEEEAARIISSMLSAVSFMHQNHIIHRDLKYENVLFVNNSPRAEIKLIDFGLSKTYAADKELTEGVGTVYTMAPEVLKGNYTSQADLWSVGVIAYMLLSSQMPFYGRKRRHIVEQIMNCHFEFKGRRWKRVSQQAKDFVEDLLVLDPEERCTAEDALRSQWLNRRFSATVRGPTTDEMDTTTETLQNFTNYSKLKKLALMVIAHKSTSEEIGILRKVFQTYDKGRDGIIGYEEFKEGLAKYGMDEVEVTRIFEGIDLDGTGKIRYTEFLAATIEAHGAIDEERLAEAFDRLDSDDSGYISAQNLQSLLGSDFPVDEIATIIAEADLEKDNKISYAEFLALWGDRNEDKRRYFYQEMRDDSFYDNSSHHEKNTMHIIADAKEADDLKKQMKNDSTHDAELLARENYLEGKKMSERKVTEGLTLDCSKDAEKILYDDVAVVIDESDDPARSPTPAMSNETRDAAAVYADI